MKIGSYSYDEYLQLVKSFHGHIAPGLIIGGFMVDLALRRLPEGVLFDAISETRACLPDAVQLLTPCTIGNGWLKVVNLGRYAVNLYDKYEGAGVRVWMDAAKVADWPEIKSWYLKLKPKAEQDKDLLMEQIREAGPRHPELAHHPNSAAFPEPAGIGGAWLSAPCAGRPIRPRMGASAGPARVRCLTWKTRRASLRPLQPSPQKRPWAAGPSTI